MFRGIVFVITACFIWGLIFVIPSFVENFSAIELAIARCFSFGILALAFLVLRKRYLFRETPREVWKAAFIFTFLANVIHYFTLVLGLRYANAGVMTLIIGTAPVCIAIFGNFQNKEFSFKPLIIPCFLLLIGLTLVNLGPLLWTENSSSLEDYLLGLVFGVISLFSWVWVAAKNSQFLKKFPNLKITDWVTVLGITTLCWSVLSIVGLLSLIATDEHLQRYFEPTEELGWFILGAIILGWGCSWIGSYLWNSASKTLPVALLGQLCIFETIFALIFLAILEMRLPDWLELVGIGVVLVGIASNVFVMRNLCKATDA